MNLVTVGEKLVRVESIGHSLHTSQDSGFQLYRVEPMNRLDTDLKGGEARDAVAAIMGVGGCSHEHDCCGCWFYDMPTVIHHDRSYDFFIVRQDSHRNV